MFIKDLDFFCKNYKPISIDELYEIVLENRKITKPIFHLTFDDGLKQVYTDIAPILEKKGIPATFFINTSFIDNKDLFYRYKISLIIEHIKSIRIEALLSYFTQVFSKIITNKNDIILELCKLDYFNQIMIDEIAVKLGINFNDFLQKYQPYLKSSEIKTLMNKGFSFGSHSLDHPHFKNISTKEQQRQITESFFILSSQFGINNKYFSFPFSDKNVKISLFNWLYESEKCRLSFGISGLKNDVNKFHLHRIPIENTSSSAEKIIKTEYLYYLLKEFLNKNTIKRDA
ncbi:MAG: polysaccharide deacetylase family protein [Bacteroidales bacterium]